MRDVSIDGRRSFNKLGEMKDSQVLKGKIK